MKGKSAVRIHRKAGYKKVSGMHFWSRGYLCKYDGFGRSIHKEIHPRAREKGKRTTGFVLISKPKEGFPNVKIPPFSGLPEASR